MVLEEEIAEPVEDRLAFVDLHAGHVMAAVDGEDVGAGVDGRVGERGQEGIRYLQVPVDLRALETRPLTRNEAS